MKWLENKWPAVLLLPFSMLYYSIVQIRNLLYNVGLFKSYRVNAKVISVGNVTVGGTGKTPTVQFLANLLLQSDKSVAIVSRGYGRSISDTVVVSDGRRVFAVSQEGGDEPLMLAKNCPGAVVIVDADRVRAAQLAICNYHCNVIILDDAFQHRRIARDLNIVLMKRDSPFGNGFGLPAGPLREPKRNLHRADIIIINGENSSSLPPMPISGKLLVSADYQWVDCINSNDEILFPHDLYGKNVIAFCGIAHPEHFKRMLVKMNLCAFFAFKDHHFYTDDDMSVIENAVGRLCPDVVLTTEKDWVKLNPEWLGGVLYRVRITLKIQQDREFVSLIEKII